MDAEDRRNSEVETSLQGTEPRNSDFRTKPPTPAQNVALTLKIIGGAAIMGLLLWLLDPTNR